VGIKYYSKENKERERNRKEERVRNGEQID
jgi:hypothetical protein